MEVNGFTLHNEDKVNRALFGTPDAKGVLVGGVAKEDGSFDDDALLAAYDKLGGYITKGSDKVKTGSFFDFQNKRPLEKAKVVFVYNVNGQFVEVEDGKELPGEVKATRILEEKAAEQKKAKKTKAKK